MHGSTGGGWTRVQTNTRSTPAAYLTEWPGVRVSMIVGRSGFEIVPDRPAQKPGGLAFETQVLIGPPATARGIHAHVCYTHWGY